MEDGYSYHDNYHKGTYSNGGLCSEYYWKDKRNFIKPSKDNYNKNLEKPLKITKLDLLMISLATIIMIITS